MITVVFGNDGAGDDLAEWLKSDASVEIEAKSVKEMLERLSEMYPRVRETFIYEQLTVRFYPPFIIKVNERFLYPVREVHAARFEDGDAVLITHFNGGTKTKHRQLMEELIEEKRARSEGDLTS